ncbi:mRNA cap guanine-N7 methyltransferase [Coccidioides posadasii str. Silveira]|uniref:mRNA cap guanine-N7 methyltransferase n=1 Tax=Coccidioides posadasii (strain RMSCC 757 / Silveira) TaxID=443226 RepID=UPI001BEF0664|nr:mRNA cap guanine-N7 methyltransferase [Coccidioides posadasii str. Silveira]
MYDPARDSFTTSDESPSRKTGSSTKCSPFHSQGNVLGATDLDSEQGNEPHPSMLSNAITGTQSSEPGWLFGEWRVEICANLL